MVHFLAVMSDADKFLSVFRWAVEQSAISGTAQGAASSLEGVEIRDLPGPRVTPGDSGYYAPKPMTEEDKKFLEDAIKSITVSWFGPGLRASFRLVFITQS